MPSPATLELRELQARELARGVAYVVKHNGPNREQRRHGVLPPGARLHDLPPKITVRRDQRVAGTNRPLVTRLAVLAPQLSRRDRRIVSRDPALAAFYRGQSATRRGAA